MGRELNPLDEPIDLEPEPLPPPGDERREELRRRADELAAEVEALSAKTERERIDPTKLVVENEIASQFDEYDNWNLRIIDSRDDMVYKWVYRDPSGKFGGYHVMREKTLGWEVVQGTGPESPEARNYLYVDGTRVVGDCLLMRVRKDRYIMLSRREHAKAQRQQQTVTSRLEELGEEAQRRGLGRVSVGPENMNPKIAERLFKTSTAKRMVESTVEQMIRDGRMPGVPAPGKRG